VSPLQLPRPHRAGRDRHHRLYQKGEGGHQGAERDRAEVRRGERGRLTVVYVLFFTSSTFPTFEPRSILLPLIIISLSRTFFLPYSIRGVVVATRGHWRRLSGASVWGPDNKIVLLDQKEMPLGTRIKGFVPWEVRRSLGRLGAKLLLIGDGII
jgi:hypothetical protein